MTTFFFFKFKLLFFVTNIIINAMIIVRNVASKCDMFYSTM